MAESKIENGTINTPLTVLKKDIAATNISHHNRPNPTLPLVLPSTQADLEYLDCSALYLSSLCSGGSSGSLEVSFTVLVFIVTAALRPFAFTATTFT